MGSSKNYKSDRDWDQKRKRYRSRSKSRNYSLENNRIDKRRHNNKHKRKNYDSDIEIISESYQPKFSKNFYQFIPQTSKISNLNFKKKKSEASSLSIQDTNRLRAKIGLKPLEVNPNPKNGNVFKDDLGEFYHKPAVNISEKEKSQKIKAKIGTLKEKRKLGTSLSNFKNLAESISDEDLSGWIIKSKKLIEDKKKAEDRAKVFYEFDEQFRLGNLVNRVFNNDASKTYTEKDLKGLKVEHKIDYFNEGKTVILNLKDQPVSAEENDVLINVNMTDDERSRRNVLLKSKKSGYDAYAENNFDEYGAPINTMLSKYDEVIEGEKKDSFFIGSTNLKALKKANPVKILENKRLETALKLAQDYYNEEELAKFKKTKKKIRQIRKNKVLKEDEITPNHENNLRGLGSRQDRSDTSELMNNIMETKDMSISIFDFENIKIEEDDEVLEQRIKKKTEKLKKPMFFSKPENIAKTITQDNTEEIYSDGTMTFEPILEFCRNVGAVIPAYESPKNRIDNISEPMECEENEKIEVTEDQNNFENQGTWNSTVEVDIRSKEPIRTEEIIFGPQPSMTKGVLGALIFALNCGYLDKAENKRPASRFSKLSNIKAQNFVTENKTYGLHDKFERETSYGPLVEFKEKVGYKPNIKIEHFDDHGNPLNQKQAYKYLSHKFHGKGPGKNKLEKLEKKKNMEVR